MPKLDKQDQRIADLMRRAAQDTRQQEKRLVTLFGKQEIPKVNAKTLAIYFDYLTQHLEFPCSLTGIEDRGCFAWEERYRFLPDRAEEYAERRKQEPSYKDTYELRNFEDEYDPYAGLMVKVQRVPGHKRFVLPLVDLKATDQQSPNYQLLHDYTVWIVNWRRWDSWSAPCPKKFSRHPTSVIVGISLISSRRPSGKRKP